MMAQPPSAKALVEDFKLKERARERGQRDLPSSDSRRLDIPETEIVSHCEDLFAERLKEYSRDRVAQEERMRMPAGSAAGADEIVEQACLDIKEAVEEERAELETLARTAQQAIGDHNKFRREEGLTREADYPQSRALHIGFLLGLILVETLINGLFFGANVEGGLFAGTSYAVLISIVNVVGLGLIAAVLLRRTRHREPLQKMMGWVLLAIVVLVAVVWNLFVGHYREALAVDYPPEPEPAAIVLAPEAGSAAEGIDSCWRGPDEADADQEALCLFLENPVRLGGFYSYMLLLIGLLAWLLGAADWFHLDDPYPGYGRRDRRRRKAERDLRDECAELLEDLKETHDEAQSRLAGSFTDPAESRKLALSAFDDLRRRHRDLRDYARSLEASVRGALDIYRTNNEETRKTPEPSVWGSAWKADWEVPDAPDPEAVLSEEEAAERSRTESALLRERQERLRACLEKCGDVIIEIRKIDYFDGAGPQ